ncbi:glycosyltransferase family 4 protein [Clostridium thermobutyricum]|uniref:glycosyltransferase family 4 protein n=1 Tax=Clostridium thermobutyricum TaxID=29372 RepID=UPI00294274F4|nr:glycosyltransferase family 4 protein [Clostridium thermobutyricum]
MRKILYVTNISRTVNTFFIPHMNALIKQGYKVDCACRISGEHELNSEKIDEKINFYDVPFTRDPISYKNLIAFYKLYKIQKKEKYDAIHVHTPIASFYTRLLKIFFKDIKMIYTAHGYHFYKGSSKLSWLVFYNVEKLLSKYTDLLITINEEDYNNSKQFKCRSLIKMNGVGVDFSEFKTLSQIEKIKIRERLGFKKEDFILIMVGEHNKNKNQIQLIKAMQKIQKEYKHIKAIFIGDGELLEENKKYIKENKINNCIILGFRIDVNELINMSDVLVSMSFREGLPKNIIEGLALEKPIIATNIRGNNELVKNGKNGYLVKLNNVEDIKKAILELNENNKYIEFSKNSLKMSKKYEMKKIIEELLEIY